MASLSSIAVALAKLGIKKSSGGPTISTAAPQPLALTAAAGSTGQASDAGHVHAFPTAAQINALGLPAPWNPVTNVAVLPNGGGNYSLLANAAPTGDNAFYSSLAGQQTLLVPLTLAAGGTLTQVNQNDIVYWTGAGWAIAFASANGTIGSVPLAGNGVGGIRNAVPGTGGDYAPPITYQTGVPTLIAPPAIFGPNGFFSIPGPWVFYNNTTYVTAQYYYIFGAWMYFQSGVITPTAPAGFYWCINPITGVMYGTITAAGTGYTNGSYTNVPLTNVTGTGTAALANITVAGGAVTSVVITHVGTGYAVGNTLSVAPASVGGTGTGFVYTVSVLSQYNNSSGLATVGINNGGTGYTNGTYTNVPLTASTGVGVGAQATITVIGGVVTFVSITMQGSGYAIGNVLVIPALGGTGTGCQFLVSGLGGPMVGIAYNNTYVLGNNTGAWSPTNLSINIPATPTPFTGVTGGLMAGGFTSNVPALGTWKIPGGSMGNNGSLYLKYATQAMNSTYNKAFQMQGSGLSLGQQMGITSSYRFSQTADLYNRGRPDVQWGFGADMINPGNDIITVSTVNTAVDQYLSMGVKIFTLTGLLMTQGIFTPGTGYTNGTYANVALTGGSGTGLQATIVVAGGAVTSVTITNQGAGYATSDYLYAPATIGPGSSFFFGFSGGVVTKGSGYTNGTYANVPLTNITGTGTGATATIVVAGGSITQIAVTNPGTGYAAGNTLSASTAYLGAGTGFVYTVGNNLASADWACLETLSLSINPGV